MVGKYKRGWEDALDVALHYRDWEMLEGIKKDLESERLATLKVGP